MAGFTQSQGFFVMRPQNTKSNLTNNKRSMSGTSKLSRDLYDDDRTLVSNQGFNYKKNTFTTQMYNDREVNKS